LSLVVTVSSTSVRGRGLTRRVESYNNEDDEVAVNEFYDYVNAAASSNDERDDIENRSSGEGIVGDFIENINKFSDSDQDDYVDEDKFFALENEEMDILSRSQNVNNENYEESDADEHVMEMISRSQNDVSNDDDFDSEVDVEEDQFVLLDSEDDEEEDEEYNIEEDHFVLLDSEDEEYDTDEEYDMEGELIVPRSPNGVSDYDFDSDVDVDADSLDLNADHTTTNYDNDDPIDDDHLPDHDAINTNVDPNTKIEITRLSAEGITVRFEDGDIVIEKSVLKKNSNSFKSIKIEGIDVDDLLPQKGASRRSITTKSTKGSVPDNLAVHAYPHSSSSGGKKKNENANLRHAFNEDTRQVFQDTSYPWSAVGRVSSGCTGTMVGPRHVLTAAHCLEKNSPMTFTPGYYNGEAPFGVATVEKAIHWNLVHLDDGFTNNEVAFDYVVLIVDHDIGDLTGWAGTKDYHRDWNGQTFWTNVGYPAGLTGTQRPVYTNHGAITTLESYERNGQMGKVLGHFIDIEVGHSGGPIWGCWPDEDFPSIIGVQSSESFKPDNTIHGDNQAAGGKSLLDLVTYATEKY